jgi:hypothetical protein
VTQPILFATEDGEHCPATDGAVVGLNPKKDNTRTGNISEKMFDIEASKRGWLVAMNSGGAPDFDFIIKRPDKARCVVVQVKTAFWKAKYSFYQFQTSVSSRVGTRRSYSETAFDALAVYLRESDCWLFYTRGEIGNRKGSTYTPPHMRQKRSNPTALDSRAVNNWELLDTIAESSTANR